MSRADPEFALDAPELRHVPFDVGHRKRLLLEDAIERILDVLARHTIEHTLDPCPGARFVAAGTVSTHAIQIDVS